MINVVTTAGRSVRRLSVGDVLRLPGMAPGITLLLLLAIWQCVVSVIGVESYMLPAPVDVAQSLVDDRALLWEHTRVTLLETLIGFGLSAAVGVPLAIVMTAWPPVGRGLYPLIVSSQVIPKVAIAPLVVVWMGTGTMTSSLLAFVMAFFPVVVNTTHGLESVDRDSIYLIRSMKGGKLQQFRYLRLPNSLPFVVTGLKLAMALSVVGALVGEFVGSQEGLGYLLLVAQGNLNTALLFADLIVLTLLGLALYYLVEFIGARVVRWQ